MGLWAFYFLIKIILFYTGYINFHFFVNLAFALALIFSHARPRLLQIKRWVAIPIGIILFYFDSPLPPLRNIIAKLDQLLGFSFNYYIELLGRILDCPPSKAAGSVPRGTWIISISVFSFMPFSLSNFRNKDVLVVGMRPVTTF